jgi:uncharacterized repeat protein (TIGR01451 family)
MKSFLSSLRQVDRQAVAKRQPKHNAIDRELPISPSIVTWLKPAWIADNKSVLLQDRYATVATKIIAAGCLSLTAIFGIFQQKAVALPVCSAVYASVFKQSPTAYYKPIYTLSGTTATALTGVTASSQNVSAIAQGIDTKIYFDNGTTTNAGNNAAIYNYNGSTTALMSGQWQSWSASSGPGGGWDGNIYYIGADYHLYQVSTAGVVTNLGALAPSGTDTIYNTLQYGDVASDANGRIFWYASDKNTGLSYLYRIDKNTLKATNLGNTGPNSASGLAFNSAGKLITTTVSSGTQTYSIDPGTLVSTLLGTVTGVPAGQVVYDLASCTMPTEDPNIGIAKSVANITAAQNPAITANSGNKLEYTVTITNTGNLASDSTTLSDAIPTGTTYVAGSTKLNGVAVADISGKMPYDPASTGTRLVNTASQPPGSVLVGATNAAVIKFQVTVNGSGVPATITNTASAGYPTVSNGVTTTNPVAGTASVSTPSILGTVFEDPNYGGGAGRPLSTLTTSPRPGARVELYTAAGAYKGFVTTDANGLYKFDSTSPTGLLANGTYKVRVVNSTVTSSRSTATTLIPVQTFHRTEGVTTPMADDTTVGGSVPNEVDAPANTGSQTITTLNGLTAPAQEVQSFSLVTVGTAAAAVTGVDFGYNFDTIVNTNDGGQGSLRQFILNSNTLHGEASLAQAGSRSNAGVTQALPAGTESSIFMIPAAKLTSGVAVISVVTALPTIDDPNTSIDGTTQTVNIGDTNSGFTGAGGSVGTTLRSLSTVNKPEVEINDGTLSLPTGLSIRANNTTVRGMSIWGFGSTNTIAAFAGDIVVSNVLLSGGKPACTTSDSFTGLLFEQNLLGTTANSFSAVPLNAANNGKAFYSACGSAGIFQNNLVGFTQNTAAFWANYQNANSNMNWTISNNEFRDGGNIDKVDNVAIEQSSSNVSLTGNLITGSYANGVSLFNNAPSSNILVNNNTISNAGRGAVSTEWAGIGVFTGTNGGIVISNNMIQSNKGAGIWVETNFQGVTITQNSMFGNGGLGIDLKGGDSGSGNQTVLTTATTPTVTPNDGLFGVNVLNTGGTSTSVANNGMDYPIITSSVLSGTTLTVKGYVGGLGTDNSTFAGANLEFFTAAADTNDVGTVFSTGSTATKLHGEGKTYLNGATVCTTDATGAFNCALTGVSATVDPYNITATATKSGNTSEFSSVASPGANVLLVKRITAINGTSLTGVVHEFTTGGNDRNPNWPSATYLQGAIDGGKVQTNDVIEYTIYFLNTGGRDAKTARICDDIKPNQAFQPDKYATGKGISVQMGNTATTLTNTDDPTTDRGQYIAVGGTFPTNCGLTTTNPAIVVDLAGSTGTPSLTAVPFATGAGAPLNSYGFVRFTTKVGP